MEVKPEECIELKNIMYKTMLMNGSPIKETKSFNELSNIEKFLEDEKNNNKNEPWSKLDKTIKIQKLLDFTEVYQKEKNLTDIEKDLMNKFLKECLDRKKLIRVKDVTYDKTKGLIKDIPALLYNKNVKHFTLRNTDKRVSTIKSLPMRKGVRKPLSSQETETEDEEIELSCA
jgi:hypothetical protein